MIVVTHYENKNYLVKEEGKEVWINPKQIISIRRRWSSLFKGGKWHTVDTGMFTVICRDNIHYRVSKDDAFLLCAI